MIKSVLILWIFQVSLGAQFDSTINDFKVEVQDKVSTEGANLVSRLEQGVADIQDRVTQHIDELSQSLHHITSTRRVKRDSIFELKNRFSPNFFTIINLVTCRHLTNITGEISSTLGDSATLVAKIMGTATNYSMALSNCSGNPLCIMSVVLLTGQVVKDVMLEVDHFVAEIRGRAQKIISIFLTCAMGETLPTPSPSNSTSETPTNNTTQPSPPQINHSRLQEESGDSNSLESGDIKFSWR